MPIQFPCSKCGKEVTAPDAAGGKRGKCPRCGELIDIPAPPPAEEEDDLIPLAPIDEEEERREEQTRRALYEQEQAVLSERGGPTPVPLDQRDDLASEDLHHFVVNFCLDMANGRLDRAPQHAEKLREFGQTGRQAVMDFVSGDVEEPALGKIPAPVLAAFLEQLKDRVS